MSEQAETAHAVDEAAAVYEAILDEIANLEEYAR